MIETKAIDADGVPVLCPHCEGVLYTALPTSWEIDEPPYSDGDTIPIYHALRSDQRNGFGWSAMLNAGFCIHCGSGLFQIVATFMDAEPNDDVENTFFHRNADRGVETHFVGNRAHEQWIITRCDTPQGPMLEHEFGPFDDTFGDWIGPVGVAACVNGDLWDMAREFLLERWDELRLMPKALGLDPDDPRVHSHRVPNSAAAGRAAYAAEKEKREAERLGKKRDRGPPLDDDIPF